MKYKYFMHIGNIVSQVHKFPNNACSIIVELPFNLNTLTSTEQLQSVTHLVAKSQGWEIMSADIINFLLLEKSEFGALVPINKLSHDEILELKSKMKSTMFNKLSSYFETSLTHSQRGEWN